MDANYIASHIYKITHLYTEKPKRIENSLWRIASNANLFWDGESDNLNSDGTLTEEQREKVWEFIEEFQANPSHQEALKTWEESMKKDDNEDLDEYIATTGFLEFEYDYCETNEDIELAAIVELH